MRSTSVIVGGIVTVAAALAIRQLRKSEVDDRNQKHMSQSEMDYRNAGTRILILGAGFGGLMTALKLDKEFKHSSDVSILVVDRDNDMLFTPLLWTMANGRTSPNNVVVPIRDFQRGRRFHVLHAEVEHIDLDSKQVQTSDGNRPYDFLVIALGSHTSTPDLPGLRTYAIPFHTPANALQLRNHLIDAIEAAHQIENPEERCAWLTFVVGGAGDTGVELAATIHEYLISGLLKAYPWLIDERIRIIIIGHAKRVLPTSKASTSLLVRQVLEHEGIEVLTGTAITGVTETTVETSTGSIPARTFFWAAGTTPSEIVSELPVEHARNGAVMVNEYLRIPTHPSVYVIGDSAWAYDTESHDPIPGTGQAAEQQGKYVGKTIAAEHMGKPVQTYRYAPLGHLALLGHYKGVAELGPFTFDGLPAFLFWHLAYLIRIPSWNKRIRLVVDWLLSSTLGREIGQIRLNSPEEYSKVLKTRA